MLSCAVRKYSLYHTVINIGMQLNLTVVRINHVSPNLIPPTLNTCIINSIEVVTLTKIKSANI